jgi:hypothetical protein
MRASSRGWSYLRLGKGLYYRRRGWRSWKTASTLWPSSLKTKVDSFG